jgi:anti-sigma factor RsiW
MHAVVMESLEEYLSGTLEPASHREIEAHLSTCPLCREEIRSMQDVSQLFVSLRSEEAWDPSPGFYAGVMREAGARKATPSFASLFALDFAFGRRIVFASLLTLAVLGSYLVTRESGYPGGPTPEGVMAQQNSPSFDSVPARDNMLVTLTAYDQH